MLIFEIKSIFLKVCSITKQRFLCALSRKSIVVAHCVFVFSVSIPISHVNFCVQRTSCFVQSHERIQRNNEKATGLVSQLKALELNKRKDILVRTPDNPGQNVLFHDLLKQELQDTGIDGSMSEYAVANQGMPDQVVRCISYFADKRRRDFISRLNRGQKIIPMIQQKIQDRGLPRELAWIPLLESSYHPRANGLGLNLGLWQLDSKYAKKFGLTVGSGHDERLDPEKSTDAALDALEYLYDKFGRWDLAIAAYNAGESCIWEAIEKSDSRDFWTIAKKSLIPRKTHFYVSSILAIQHILDNPSEYGIEGIKQSLADMDTSHRIKIILGAFMQL